MSGILKKLLGSHIAVIFFSFSLLTFALSYFMDSYYREIITEKLELSTNLLKTIFYEPLLKNETDKIQKLTRALEQETNSRITIINPEGIVIADSGKEPWEMENHSNRPEIKMALSGKPGENIHYSSTLKVNMLYVAVPVMEKEKLIGIIRVSEPLSAVKTGIRHIQKRILIAVFIALLAGFAFSFITNTSLVKPLLLMTDIAGQMARGRYHQKLDIKSSDELGNLAASFNVLSSEIQKKVTELTEEKNHLKNNERFRSEFVANVSHEIKTPVTAITGAVETLLECPLDNKDEITEFLKIVSDHSRRLNGIVNDLLALAKLETENIRPEISAVDIRKLIDSSLLLFEENMRIKNISLAVDIPDEASRLSADEKKIEQVFINLLDNAVKFTPVNGKISVRAVKLADTVKIDVEDTGIGISPEHIGRIFERFYRVDPARSRDLGGTGLGLSIVKHIVQLHGGKISVSSVPGQGTVFSIYLPVNLSSI